jgi:hypothetical protein
MHDARVLQLIPAEFAEVFAVLVRQYQKIDSMAEAAELLHAGMDGSSYIRQTVEGINGSCTTK